MSERPLGEVFDDVAEDHDRVRAGYPSELVASALDQAASLTGRGEGPRRDYGVVVPLKRIGFLASCVSSGGRRRDREDGGLVPRRGEWVLGGG